MHDFAVALCVDDAAVADDARDDAVRRRHAAVDDAVPVRLFREDAAVELDDVLARPADGFAERLCKTAPLRLFAAHGHVEHRMEIENFAFLALAIHRDLQEIKRILLDIE